MAKKQKIKSLLHKLVFFSVSETRHVIWSVSTFFCPNFYGMYFPTENIATDSISPTKRRTSHFGILEVKKFYNFPLTSFFWLIDANLDNLTKLIHENEKIRNESLKYVDFWMKEIHTFTLNHQHSPPVPFLGVCDLIKRDFKLQEGGKFFVN